MAVTKLNFETKITNKGATSSGRLSADEFNLIPAKVDELVDDVNNKSTKITEVEGTANDAKTIATTAEQHATEAGSKADEALAKANGIDLTVYQKKLIKGDNVTLEEQEDGTVKISATGGGGSVTGVVKKISVNNTEFTPDADGLVDLGQLGGGTVGAVMKLRSVTDAALSAIVGDAVPITYTFTSVYSDDQSSTGSGTAVYKVNGTTVSTDIIEQGNVTFNLMQYLITGTNTVSVTVSDSTGNSRSLTYTVEVIVLRIESSFDGTQIFTDSAIDFKYTPYGAISKTVHFLIDGSEVATEDTSLSNRQLTRSIPQQTHGAHLLRVYMTATVGGKTVQSNSIYFDLICATTGDTTPIVASAYQPTQVTQYDTVNIPYMVYTPGASNSDVTVTVNDTDTTTLSVDRTQQTFTYRTEVSGTLKVVIACGISSKTFNVPVTESSVIIQAESNNLELYLTSKNRSNSDVNRAVWTYNSTTATLQGFNWVSNGWIKDAEGNIALRVSGGATVTIPFQIFATDFRANGKTIELEVAARDVISLSDTILSCFNESIGLKLTCQELDFQSEQSSTSAFYKSEEHVRLSIVVTEKGGDRLVYLYINGLITSVSRYAVLDNFQQSTPVNITIGNTDCTIDVYNIRVYGNDLTQFQMLDNYMADIADVDAKLAVYNRNQVYNAYGDIQYTLVNNKIQCFTWIGDLPSYKGDKKTGVLVYENKSYPEKNWTASGAQIDVQGTSSQYYPRKNFKIKAKNGFVMTATSEAAATVAIADGQIPVNVFTFKADFAESSGCHNTGFANWVDYATKALKLYTPAQQAQVTANGSTNIRTTIYGEPCVFWHKGTSADTEEFIGKYNWNNDKSSAETFGFVSGDECWEVLNNTSDGVLFKSADFTTLADGKPKWLNDFEARFPDSDTLNAEYAAGKIPEHLKALCEFLASCYDSSKTGSERFLWQTFQTGYKTYFDGDYLTFYEIATEFGAMVDQKAKNMMLFYCASSGKWYIIFYDNDTQLGLNNETVVAFGPYVEFGDVQGSQAVFNGSDSVLHNCYELMMANTRDAATGLNDMDRMYYNMRQQGVLSYDKMNYYYDTLQCDKWCEAIYNLDTQYKYISPLLNGYMDYSTDPAKIAYTDYLYAAQGDRKQHRHWWLASRFKYIDSKHVAGNFIANYVTMRLYTPTDYAGVTPNADFALTLRNRMYTRIKFGSYIVTGKGGAGETVNMPAPAITFNDTETIIYGVDDIEDLGDLSGKYVGTIDISKATNFTKLLLGSSAEGYHNDNLLQVNVGTNTKMQEIDVQNCPNFGTGTQREFDVSACKNLKKLRAKGTSLASVKMVNGGAISELQLPDSITMLELMNQPYLTDAGFSAAGVSNLKTIIVEGTPNVDLFTLLASCLQNTNAETGKYVLTRARLIGISGSGTGLDLLFKMASIGGLDANGNNVDVAVITGTYNAKWVYESQLSTVQIKFPELVINYTAVAVEFADAAVKAICIANWGNSADGYITKAQCAAVSSIGTKFQNNTSVVYFNELKNFTQITSTQNAQFSGCTALQEIDLSNITTLSGVDGYQRWGFEGCTSLKKVILSNNLTAIGFAAFYNCTSLASIDLSNIKRVYANAFYGCTSLSSFGNIDNLTYIGSQAFYNTKLSGDINMPNLTSLGTAAFVNTNITSISNLGTITQFGKDGYNWSPCRFCSNLLTAVLPATLTIIGGNVFSDSPNIKWVKCLAVTPPTLNGSLVGNSTCVIYVPDASIDAYKSATNWSSYATRIKGLSEFTQ